MGEGVVGLLDVVWRELAEGERLMGGDLEREGVEGATRDAGGVKVEAALGKEGDDEMRLCVDDLKEGCHGVTGEAVSVRGVCDAMR